MLKVKDIMTKNPITVFPETEVVKAANLLFEHHINGLPVIDHNNKVLGILCQSDLIVQQKKLPIPSFFTILDGFIPLASGKQLEKEVQKITAITVEQAMTKNPIVVEPDTGVEVVAALMVDEGFHTLPVVEKGVLVGVVGKEDVLKIILDL